METYRYRTGYLVTKEEADSLEISRGKKYFISFEKEKPEHEEKLSDKFINREVIINASSLKRAVEVSRLIYAALCLIEGCSHPTPFWDTDTIPQIIPVDTAEKDEYFNQYMQFEKINGPNFILAIEIANKVSFKRKWRNALITYKTATCIHSNSIDDLDPFMNIERVSITPYLDDKIRMAFAISIYYSSIDGLGLAWPAKKDSVYKKSQKPHTVNRAKLYKNLSKIGIKNTDRILWGRRNKKTKIQKKKNIKGYPNNWNLPYVQDVNITFYNAITEISWIRSSLVAHKIDDKYISSLSIYDVDNANSLARRILLHTFGFWDTNFKPQKKDKKEQRKWEKKQQKIMNDFIKESYIRRFVKILKKEIEKNRS